jgi:protein O-mannosyl-transferase
MSFTVAHFTVLLIFAYFTARYNCIMARAKIKEQQQLNMPPTPPGSFYLALQRFEQQKLWHVILLFILTFFLFIKTVNYQLINLDDTAIISNNLDILTNIKNIPLAFKTDAFISSHGDYYRPLQTVTFFIDASLGKGNVWIFHLTNLLLHILTSMGVYFLLRQLKLRPLVSFALSLLFAIHPMLASAVSWVPARGDLLLGLFGVLSVYSFNEYFKKNSTKYLILHLVFFLLAVFSKETALLLPLICLATDITIVKRAEQRKKLLAFVIMWIAVGMLFFVLRSKVVTGTPPDFIFGIHPFFKNLPGILILFAKFLIPVGLSPMPLFDTTFTAIGGVLLLLALFLIWRSRGEKKQLMVFGFVWFLLTVIPPLFFKLYYSNFVLEYYEHRAYLPYVGLAIFFGAVLNSRLFTSSLQTTVLPLLIIVTFAFIASFHSDDFRDSMAFFSKAADMGNPGAVVKRGELYMADRNYNNALEDFNKGIELSDNGYPLAFSGRAALKAEAMKDHAGAEADYTKSLELDSTAVDAYIRRANERILLQNIQGALMDVTKAKHLDSSNNKIYSTLGSIYVNTSNFPAAIGAFSQAIARDSLDAESYNNRGFARYRVQDYQAAYADCNRATQIYPQYLNAYYNKGMVMLELGKPQMAITTFDTTLSLANNFYFGWFYRGMAKKATNDLKGACADWQESVKLGFTMAQDTINKYCH